MMTMKGWEERRERFLELAARDPEHRFFGAKSHRYRLNPPLLEADLLALEDRYRVRLPGEYRSYLAQFSNGGAGPGYGVFPAGWDAFSDAPWDESLMVSSLREPFRFSSEWLIPPECMAGCVDEFLPLNEAEQRAKDALGEVGLLLRSPDGSSSRKNPFTGAPLVETERVLLCERLSEGDLMDGAVPICDWGCEILDFLVISGPERGHIWRWEDDRIFPLTGPSALRLTLDAWFDSWLDDLSREPSPGVR